jgi:hypothetical protein
METTIKQLDEAAEQNGWTKRYLGSDVYEYISPFDKQIYEPQKLTVTSIDGRVSTKRNANHIYVDIDSGRGLKAYGIPALGTLQTIKNTKHPLRSKFFFEKVKGKGLNHSKLIEPFNISPSKIKNPAIRGYFPLFDADNLSIHLLNAHPQDIWGADAWYHAVVEDWA